jgi:hypothetical protein
MGIRLLIVRAKAFGREKAVSCLPYCRAIVFLSGKRVNAKIHDFDNLSSCDSDRAIKANFPCSQDPMQAA